MDVVISALSTDGTMKARTQTAVTTLLAGLLILAPLFRAGQAPLAMLVLELLALGVLLMLLWAPPGGLLTKREGFAVILLLSVPLLYLLPVPFQWAGWLPGRALYLESASLMGLEDTGMRLAIVPGATESALLALLLPVAVFVGTRALDRDRVFSLVLLLIGIAAVQAILGLMQSGGSRDSVAYLGMLAADFGYAVGTYTNRNHLAGLLEMVLPVTLALLIYSMTRRSRDRKQDWRRKVSFFGTLSGNRAFIFGALAVLLILGVIFTRSRAGIALTMLGILLATFAFSRRIGGDNVYGVAGTIVAFAVGFGIVIGLAPILDRFASANPMEDARWTMFAATIDGIGALFPLGSGPGSYAEVFPAYQTLELGKWFVNYAHNDYLQWLFEGGLIAIFILVILLGLYLLQWGVVWTRERWSRFRFVQVGAGIGLLLMLLHEMVDYNLHMPANMIYFAFLAGVFFTVVDEDSEPERVRRRRKRHTPKLEDTELATAAHAGGKVAVHQEQIPNPFLDGDDIE